MNYQELENLGYTSVEIRELQELGVAELVVREHNQMEVVAQKEVVRAPWWATAALAVFSILLLTAPWATEIGDFYYRERLRFLIGKEVLDKQPTGWTCPGNRQSCYPEDMYRTYK